MKKFSALLILCISAFIYSQQKDFNFEFDYAQFAYDSSSNYIEFYYSFQQNGLSKNFRDSSVFLEGMLDIQIRDSATQEIIVDKEWKVAHQLDDSLNGNKSLVGVVSFILPSGKYECIVSGKDLADVSRNETFKEYISIHPFVRDNITMSDLQLSSRIEQDSNDKNSVFYKNTYEVIPQPTSVFGEGQPVLFYYIELYNLKSVPEETNLKLSTIVYNSRRNLMHNKSKYLNAAADSRVEVGTIMLNKLPTDSYTVVATLIDSAGNYGVSSSKKFYVLNPSVQINDSSYDEIADVFSTSFGVMSEEELDDLFSKSKYIATEREIEQYNSLSGKEGKQKFLHQFWNVRDSDPSTTRNEFFIEYQRRIEISSSQFTALGKEGWKTDRGRIFLKYGEPSEIERFPNQIDTKPYELWHYNEIEGGVVFVFADLTNFSDYQLIHSTARGELRDDNWYRRIRSI